MKVFLDANVLVSAIATRGLCADVFREVLSSEELLVSSALLDEIKRILSEKFNLPSNVISDTVTLLKTDTELSNSPKLSDIKIKDKDDIVILSDALHAHADVFITGDKEIQKCKKMGDMEILSPREFWKRLKDL